MFNVDYFHMAVFLAQIPRLANKMCVSADFESVYVIGSGLCFDLGGGCNGKEMQIYSIA